MTRIAFGQDDGDYRRELGENQSHLKHILHSPAHYKTAKKRPFRPTENMDIGSALHCLSLEGKEEFLSRFIEKPGDVKFTTKEGKAWREDNKDKTILSYEAMEKVYGMANSLKQLSWFVPNRYPEYRKYNEVSVYWTSHGIPCKGRLDRVVDEGDYVNVLDLKTTDSVDYDTFVKKVVGGLNYIFQAAWYAEAASLAFEKPAKFTFIGIERDIPHSVGVFEVSDEMMQEGLSQTRKAREMLRKCIDEDRWPGPEVSYNVMELPRWFKSTDRDAELVDLF